MRIGHSKSLLYPDKPKVPFYSVMLGGGRIMGFFFFNHSFFMMRILFCWREKTTFRNRGTDSDDMDYSNAEI